MIKKYKVLMEQQEIIKRQLDNFSDHTNRSLNQTLFLYELCDKNMHKLIALEEKIKNNILFYCPADVTEVEKILAMQTELKMLTLDQWRVFKDPNNKWTLVFKKGKQIHYVAVPPTNGNRKDTVDCRPGKEWQYHYNVKDKVFGLNVVIENGKIILPIIV